jgi:hypothetical protein
LKSDVSDPALTIKGNWFFNLPELIDKWGKEECTLLVAEGEINV